MKNFLLAGLVAAALSAFAAGGVSPGASPWNLKALHAPPKTFPVGLACSNDYGLVEGVQPIFIEGEPLRGKPTRVFAWWGLPKGASSERKVPAMVLVHGGGGTAFARWVKIWNDRGYAAIAMDTCGKIPQGERDGEPHPTHPWSGPSGWASSVAQIDDAVIDQWTYHAVAAVMRCHSFLRSRPEVDAPKTGLTGISWGGYLTSIVMGVDSRFVFAAPVYGCGFYDLNPRWGAMSSDKRRLQAWFDRWDPRNFIGGMRRSVLWCDGTNDIYYPLDSLRASCACLPQEASLFLSLKLRMPHAHPPAGDPPEITAFAEHCLKGKPAPAAVTSAALKDGALAVTFAPNGSEVVAADFLYTTSSVRPLSDRPWVSAPVVPFPPCATSFSAAIPAGTVMCFANIRTKDGLVFSTRVFSP